MPWNRRALSDCLVLLRNGLSKPQNKEGRGLPVTRIETIASGRIDPLKVGFINGLSESDITKYQLVRGDILFSHINSEPQIGRTAIYEGSPPVLLHGMNLLLLRPSTCIDTHFLHFALWHLRGVGDTAALAGRAVGQSSINQGRLRSFEIPFPEFDEQRQIAAVLLAVQRAIEQQERLIALTAELKKVLMHKLFTAGTRGESLKQAEIGPLPESWTVGPLGDYLQIAQYGLSAKGSDDGTTPILRMTNQVDGRIVARGLQMVNITQPDRLKFKLDPQDILFNRTNSFELVGRTAIFDLEGDFVFASYLIRLRTQPGRLRPAFLNHYFNWSAVQSRLKGIASRAVSQSNISASRLRTFSIPLPSPEEQDEIVNCFDEIDRVQLVHQRRLVVLQELFRVLLQQLMTASIRVHDLDLSALSEIEQRPVGIV